MKHKTGKRLILLVMAMIVAMSFALPASVSAAGKKPEKVKTLKVKNVTWQSATIKWTKAKRARTYEVYRSLNKDSGYQLIKTTKKRKFTDSGLNTGTKYWYRVRGINKKFAGKLSQKVSAKPYLSAPSISTVARGEGVGVSIDRVGGADGYKIYRDGKELIQTEAQWYLDTNVQLGEKHKYAAKAYRIVNGKKIFSAKGKEKTSAKAKPTASIRNGTKLEGADLPVGKSYSIRGMIEANTEIGLLHVGVKERVQDRVQDPETGNWVSGDWVSGDWVTEAHYKKTSPGTTTFNIADRPNSKVKFGSLEIGEYYYVVDVVLIDGTELELTKQAFTISEAGSNPPYEEPVEFPANVTEGAKNAVKWAKKIANDNSFAYGTGGRSHRGGCYFCGTNTGPNLKKKEKSGEKHYVKDSNGVKHTYEKTYCCNPFIFAAYAHGAKDSQILKACKKGKCGGMSTGDWTKYGCFAVVGACKKVPYSQILPGDVIISDKSINGHYHHVIMDCGNDQYVEAGWEGWGASTIAVRSGAEKNYNKHYKKYKGCYVLRYTGK